MIVAIYIPKAITVSNMNTLRCKMKEEFTQQAIRQLLCYLTLTFDCKAITDIQNLCFYLHTISNHYNNVNDCHQKNERGVFITIYKTDFKYNWH